MKAFDIALLAFIAAASACNADQHPKTACTPPEVHRYGEPVRDDEKVKIETIWSAMDRYAEKTVCAVGSVWSVDPNGGCSMELASNAAKVHVELPQCGLALPVNERARRARVFGRVVVKTWSAEEVSALESNGRRMVKEPDGTAKELSILARGVEILEPCFRID